jgi:hypothetical protein
MNKQLQNKIKTYSALAATAAFSASQANAQLVTRTINETNDGFDFGTYELDMDDNGTIDFVMYALDYSPYLSGFGFTGAWGYVGIYGYYTQNRLFSTPYSYNLNLPAGERVGDFNTWYAGSFNSSANLVNGIDAENDSTGDIIGVAGGDFSEKSSAYLGVRFLAEDEDGDFNFHYGWIRFTNVSRIGDKWTIAEVGYDAQPEVSTYADQSYKTDYSITKAQIDFDNVTNLSKEVRVNKIEHEHGDDVSYFYVTLVRENEFPNLADIKVPSDVTNGNYYSLNDGDRTGTPIQDYVGNDIVPGLTYNVYTVVMGNFNDPLRMSMTTSVFSQPLSIEELSAQVLDIYAADKTVNINFGSNFDNAPVKIYDVTGKEVYSGKLASNKFSVELNESVGIYIVSVEGKESKTTQKVVLR